MDFVDTISNIYAFCYQHLRFNEVSKTFNEAQILYMNSIYPFWNSDKRLYMLYLQHSSLKGDWNSFLQIMRYYRDDILVLVDALIMSHCNKEHRIANYIYLDLIVPCSLYEYFKHPAISYYELLHHPETEELMIKDGKWPYIEPCMIPDQKFKHVRKACRSCFHDDFYYGTLNEPRYPTLDSIELFIKEGYTAGYMCIDQGWWSQNDDNPIHILYNPNWDILLLDLDLKDQTVHISYRMAKALALKIHITESLFQ